MFPIKRTLNKKPTVRWAGCLVFRAEKYGQVSIRSTVIRGDCVDGGRMVSPPYCEHTMTSSRIGKGFDVQQVILFRCITDAALDMTGDNHT